MVNNILNDKIFYGTPAYHKRNIIRNYSKYINKIISVLNSFRKANQIEELKMNVSQSQTIRYIIS